MTSKSLFKIILKVFGLFFLREIILILPQLFSAFVYLTQDGGIKEGLLTFFLTSIIIAFYLFLIYQLLFKTDYLVEKLKLDQGFEEKKFTFNFSAIHILTIAIIVVGGLLLVNEIPNLCRELYVYYQEKRLTKGVTNPDFSFSVFSGLKVLLGFLIIGEKKRIVSFLNRKEKEVPQE